MRLDSCIRIYNTCLALGQYLATSPDGISFEMDKSILILKEHDVDFPSNIKGKLLAARVKGALLVMTKNEDMATQEVRACISMLSPYAKVRTDQEGVQWVEGFDPTTPMLHCLDGDLSYRIQTSCRIFTGEVLPTLLSQGEQQVFKTLFVFVFAHLTVFHYLQRHLCCVYVLCVCVVCGPVYTMNTTSTSSIGTSHSRMFVEGSGCGVRHLPLLEHHRGWLGRLGGFP